MSDTILVPVTTVQPDLVTQTDVVVYVPLASKTSPGIVQIGDGLNIDNGIISVIPVDVPIKSISKNGTLIIPDENKNVNIILNKSDVGLSAVDNTSDLDKPISILTQQALDNLETTLTDNIVSVSEDLMFHAENTNNPHAVTKAQVGLSEVDNTSDKNKPISDATQTALNDKASLTKPNVFGPVLNTIPNISTSRISLKLENGFSVSVLSSYGDSENIMFGSSYSDMLLFGKNDHITYNSHNIALDTDLNDKIDKSGGIFTGNVGVQGNLSVSGTITTKDTETLKVQDNVIVTNANKIDLLDLSGLAINKNDTQTYGIMYDVVDDSVKLGLGSIDSAGKFTFNEGEGSPIATRSDSSSLTDNHLIKWDATNNKLVDSGYSAEDKLDKIINTDTYNRVYGINSDGTQTTYNVSVQPEKDSIVCRDYYGRIGSKSFYANYISNFENWDTNSERRTRITLEPKSFEMVSCIGSQYSGLTFTNDTDTNSNDMSIFGEFMGSKTTPDYAKQIGFSMNYNNVSYLENGITLRVLENLQNGKILSLTQNGLFIGDGFDAIPEGEQTLPLKNKKEISPNTIRYDIKQTLTDEQKAQARANIGAGTGSGTGGGTTVTVGGVAQETWNADSKVNTKVGTNSITINDSGITLANLKETAELGLTIGNDATLSCYGTNTADYIQLTTDNGTIIHHEKWDNSANNLVKSDLLVQDVQIMAKSEFTNEDSTITTGNMGVFQGLISIGSQTSNGGGSVISMLPNSITAYVTTNESIGSIIVQPDNIEIETTKLTYNGNEVATVNQVSSTSVTELIGTEEKPINLYNDLEKGKIYSLSGIVYSGTYYTSIKTTETPVLASVLVKKEGVDGGVYVDLINCGFEIDDLGNITIGPVGTGVYMIAGAEGVTIINSHQLIDEAMDAESTNPVQNKVIKSYIDNLILTTLNTAV